MIEIQSVTTAKDLKKILENVPDEWPVQYGDHAMAELYKIRVGELRIGGNPILAIFPE